MIVKRPILTLTALWLGLAVGACTQFSGNVADHWPHWAGGEPAGVPPRPGSPGYQDYIAHRQAEGAVPAAQAPAPAATGSAVAAQAPAAVQGGSPASAGDTAVGRGGLY